MKRRGQADPTDYSEDTPIREILRRRKGQIWREFPGEWADRTWEELEQAARSGDKVAWEARKLLQWKEYDK